MSTGTEAESGTASREEASAPVVVDASGLDANEAERVRQGVAEAMSRPAPKHDGAFMISRMKEKRRALRCQACGALMPTPAKGTRRFCSQACAAKGARKAG